MEVGQGVRSSASSHGVKRRLEDDIEPDDREANWVFPEEILFIVFQHSDPEVLFACSQVCKRWREIINDDKLWAAQCMKKGILRKDWLDECRSLFKDSSSTYKEYLPDESHLSPVCHWRRHFNRYLFLERNWRRGKYSTLKFDSVKDPCIGIIPHNKLSLYHRRSPIPSKMYGRIHVKGDYLISAQDPVLCMVWDGSCFRDLYEITLPEQFENSDDLEKPDDLENLDDFEYPGNVEFPDDFENPDNIEICIASGYGHLMMIRDIEDPYDFYFYDYTTGGLLREVNLELHMSRVNPIKLCTIANLLGHRLFLNYISGDRKHYILLYDYTLDEVVFNVEDDPTHLSSLEEGIEKLMGYEERLYIDDESVFVRDLNSQTSFKLCDDNAVQFMRVNSFGLAALATEYCVDLWDISKRQHLYTVTINEQNAHVTKFYMDDKSMVVTFFDGKRWQAWVLTFW